MNAELVEIAEFVIHPSQTDSMTVDEAMTAAALVQREAQELYGPEELSAAAFYFWSVQEDAVSKGKTAVLMAAQAASIYIQIKRLEAAARTDRELAASLAENAKVAAKQAAESFGINLKFIAGKPWIDGKPVNPVAFREFNALKKSQNDNLQQLNNLIKNGQRSRDYSSQIQVLQRTLRETLEQIGATPESAQNFQSGSLDIMARLMAVGSRLKEKAGEAGGDNLIDIEAQQKAIGYTPGAKKIDNAAQDEIDLMPQREVVAELQKIAAGTD